MADLSTTWGVQTESLKKLLKDMRDGTHALVVASSQAHDHGMDFYTAVGLGLLTPEVRRVTALGNNTDVDSGTTPEDVWSGGGAYPWMTGATSLEVVSSDAADTAAGTGARTMTISGLDTAWIEQSDVITLNGTTAVAVPKQYFRINSMVVSTAGSGETNAGTITVRDSGGGTTRGIIPLGGGISKQAIYTVPAGHTLSIHSILGSLNRSTGALTRAITLGITFRSPAGVKRNPLEFSISNIVPYRHDGIPGIPVAEKTDVSLRVTYAEADNLDVTAAFLGILMDNDVM